MASGGGKSSLFCGQYGGFFLHSGVSTF
jgi:hypothetical protein